MRRTILALTVLVAGVAAAGERACGYDQNTAIGLGRILAVSPENATPEFLAEAWLVDLPWGTRDGNLSTLSHFAYVVDDECFCCDSFTFENREGTDRLMTISLWRFQRSRASAVVVARKLADLASREPT